MCFPLLCGAVPTSEVGELCSRDGFEQQLSLALRHVSQSCTTGCLSGWPFSFKAVFMHKLLVHRLFEDKQTNKQMNKQINK